MTDIKKLFNEKKMHFAFEISVMSQRHLCAGGNRRHHVAYFVTR